MSESHGTPQPDQPSDTGSATPTPNGSGHGPADTHPGPQYGQQGAPQYGDASQHGQPQGQQPGHQQYPPPGGQPHGQQYHQQPGQPAYAPPQPVSPQDERTYAMLGHLGGIIVGFIAPLIVYLVFKDRSAYLRQHSAEALNFQILVAIAYIVGGILTIIIIGSLLMLAAWVLTVVFSIMAAMAANKGELYKYPLNVRFVK